MKAVVLSFLAAGVLLGAGCKVGGFAVKGSGTKISDTRTVDPFHSILVDSSADLRVAVGSPQSVVVEGDDNIYLGGGALTSKIDGSGEVRIR